MSEISCHARGVFYLLPEVGTIIDIGGQDAKAIKVGPRGTVVNFVMQLNITSCKRGTV